MLFSVVIPTFNNLQELKRCLDALNQQNRDDFEVIICVDGSTDGTAEFLENAKFQFPIQACFHPGRENRGRAATRNLALPFVKGEFTLFLDSDMEARSDLFDAHLQVLQSGKTVSVGRVHYRNRKGNVWVRYLSERGVAKFGAGSEVPYHYFITPNSAVPSRFFQGVEGFDAKISAYGGEDMEFGLRVYQQFQPRFIYNPAAVVETTQGKPLDEALRQLEEYGEKGLPYITEKHEELREIYWVQKCSSKKLSDRLFESMLNRPFGWMARQWVRVLPFFLKKWMIHYLVLSAVHRGFRNGQKR